ncbi:TetR/AcrR family transcriptional regulator [Vibrio sp. AK197]|uniref:TetR/AcrR family transcriptional regulator n=1 Tax=Vibrio olivae TaxID=1243002 RepID=A0ABV5HJ43_9VIBR
MKSKREQLIDTALDLFYQHGVNSIGINEVLKVSGIAKKTLYNHFQSKDALILAALEQRDKRFLSWLESCLATANSDKALVTSLFTALEQWFENCSPLGDFRGCFFANTSAEIADPESDIFKYCQAHKDKVRHLISTRLHHAKPDLIEAICLVKEGAISRAYVNGETHSAAICIRLIEPMLIQHQ